eukprot:gnl/TRDRNA2_/TRDRNA2_91044_c0_seq1.p1 gnl/TRDRNA2_/TRDRNA2_91044_c0~~gnl/TRDRNA2_/TRDRNA2_91044_c0_seq1.p1  ORF type:complete len:424 (+),score=108.96 gnl/TRDRNA2_/TRDRNA2_91044_c0_seq1:60-1274(+)
MAAEIAGWHQQRVDPKIITAMVNRFVADSTEFLQSFAQQAEVRLLELAKRIAQLERLLRLLEAKVSRLDPADVPSLVRQKPVSGGVPPPPPPAPLAGQPQQLQPVGSGAAVAETSAAADVAAEDDGVEPQAMPVEDPKYAVYRRMQRTGVPLLAIRQKLLIDAMQDPTLDVSVLDSFDGAAGTGAGAPATLPPPRPKPAAAPTAPRPQPSVSAEESAAEDPPGQIDARREEPAAAAAPPAAAAPSMIEQIAAKAKARMAAVEAKEASGSSPAPPPAPAVRPPAPSQAPKASAPAPAPVPSAARPGEYRSVVASPADGYQVAPIKPSLFVAASGKPSAPASSAGALFGQAEPADQPPAPPPPPPPPAKAKAVAASTAAATPEAAMRLRRSLVAAEESDQSDVSDF